MTTALEIEAEKMARVPGIIFADTPLGDRVARIAGTGLEVFEVILSYRAVDWDFRQFVECFPWLTGDQLLAAVQYYEAYPDEINAQMAENDMYTPEYVYEKWPFMRPKPQ